MTNRVTHVWERGERLGGRVPPSAPGDSSEIALRGCPVRSGGAWRWPRSLEPAYVRPSSPSHAAPQRPLLSCTTVPEGVSIPARTNDGMFVKWLSRMLYALCRILKMQILKSLHMKNYCQFWPQIQECEERYLRPMQVESCTPEIGTF